MFLFLDGSSPSQFQSVGGFFSGETMFRLAVRPHIGHSSPRAGKPGNTSATRAKAGTAAASSRAFTVEKLFMATSSFFSLVFGSFVGTRGRTPSDRHSLPTGSPSYGRG